MYPIRYPFDGTYKVSQKFGVNPDTYDDMDLDGHNGIDYSMNSGTPLKAVADGVVKYVGDDPEGYGHYIRIDHHIDDCHFQTLYAHSDQEPFFEVGQQVKKSDTIMLSDNYGFSTGPHLHFGLREIDEYGNTVNYDNGYKGYIDPQPWLNYGTSESSSTSVPDWAYDEVAWAINEDILDSWESAEQPVSQTEFKYTLAVMLYRYYLNLGDGLPYSGVYMTGAWPSWANDGVNWCLAVGILDSQSSVMQAVSGEEFKYTLAVMLYRYYLDIQKGLPYNGTYLSGQWPDWANEAVNFCIANYILDSASSVMEPVSEDAFKYTLAVMLYRYNKSFA